MLMIDPMIFLDENLVSLGLSKERSIPLSLVVKSIFLVFSFELITTYSKLNFSNILFMSSS